MLYWTEERVIAAIRDWAAECGYPPKIQCWQHATPATPSAQTVKKRFGTWNGGLVAAGFPPRHSKPQHWTRERVVEAIHAWVAERGRVPTAFEWKTATLHTPGERTVRHRFRTWNTAVEAAGYESRPRTGGVRG